MKRLSVAILILTILISVIFVSCSVQEEQNIIIKFHANYGEDEVSIDPNVSFKREGYTFAGWSLENNGEVISLDSISSDSEVYAQWKKNIYNVKFYVGVNLVKETSVEYLDSAIAPSDADIEPYLNGKQFISWDKSLDNVKSNLTINAVLQEQSEVYSITFKNDDAILKELNIDKDKTINNSVIPQVEKQGFSFVKWVDDKGITLNDSYTVYSNVIFTPVFALDVPSNPTLVTDKTLYTYGDTVFIKAVQNYAYENIVYSYSWSVKYGDGDLRKLSLDNQLIFALTPKYVGKITYFLTTTAKYLNETKTNTCFATVNLDKAVLNVSICDEIELEFGDSLPSTYNLKIEGFKMGDNYSSLNGEINYLTNYTNTSRIGRYDITLTGLTSDNYCINYETKSFDVKKKQIAISKEMEEKKVYDGLIYSGSYSKIFEENGVVISCNYQTNSADAKTYSVENDNLVVSNFSAKLNDINYTDCFDITYNFVITIEKAFIQYSIPNDFIFAYDSNPHEVSISTQTQGCTIEYSLDGIDYSSNSLAFINAGEYEISYRISKNNYYTEEGCLNVVINKANITLSLEKEEIVYGEPMPKFNCLIEGNSYGTTFTYDILCDYKEGSNVDNYDVIIGINEENYPNFIITTKKAVLSVQTRKINVNINDKNVVYGEELPNDISYSIGNKYYNDNNIDIIKITSDYVIGDDINSEKLLSAEIISNNYEIDSITKGKIIVTKRPILIKAKDSTVEYGNDFDISSCQSEIIDGSLFNKDELKVNYSCEYIKFSSANSTFAISSTVCIIKDDKDISENYSISSSNGILKVIPRNITILVNDRTVTYGDSINLVDCTYSVQNGEIVNRDNLAVDYSCSYVKGSPINSYEISAKSNNINYNVKARNGALTVLKRSITINVDETKARNDNTYSKLFEKEVVNNIFQGDTINGQITSTIKDTGEYSDNADFNFSNVTILNSNSEDRTDCYDITYRMYIKIDELYIQMRADNINCDYDGNYHKGELIIEEENLTNLDIKYSIDGENYSYELPEFKDAGEYIVYYYVTADNKTPTQASFTVTINKIAMTIKAISQVLYYGDAAASLEYSVLEGTFIEGEESLLDIKIVSNYSQGNSIGYYSITINIENTYNYDVTIENGTITVNPRVIDIQVENHSSVYGEEYVQPAYTATNLYNEDKSFISIKVEGNLSLLNVGQYRYIAVTTNSNYSLNINTAYLTIEKRVASITAKDLTVLYGQEAVFDSVKENLLENEIVTYSCNYKNVGEYTITPVFENSNYDLTITPATLTVIKADLNIYINVPTTTINYGEELPVYTISKYEGFAYEEDQTVLKGAFDYHCAYMDTKKAGSYMIEFLGLSADNYNIVYPKVNCLVNKVILTFTIDEIAPITYLDPVPKYTYTVSGYVNGDNNSAYSGVNIVSTYKQNDNASSIGYAYYIDVSKAVSDNYTFETNGTKYLVVNKLTPTNVTCDAIKGITYDPYATLSTYESLLPQYFRWVSPETIPTCAVSLYDVVYNPNSTNYNDVYVSVSMVVAKASSTIAYISDRTEYTGSEINYMDIIKASTNNTDNAVVDYNTYSNIIKDGGRYSIKLTVFETANYLGCSTTIIFKVSSALIGSTYYTIEEALSVGGDIIILGDSFITAGEYELKSGSTLSLYYDSANTKLNTYATTERRHFADFEESIYLKKRLTLKSGVTLKVYGTINIGGITNSAKVGMNGHTSEDYTQIDIDNNSTMIVKSGGLIQCYGYIKGNGSTIYESGAIAYYPFVIRDFKGGSNTKAIYEDAGASPFEQYEVPNNQTYQTIYSGAEIKVYCVLYANNEHNETKSTFIGKTTGILKLTNGYINLHVVPQSKEENAVTISYFNFNGEVSLGSLSLKVVLFVIVKVNVDTSTVLFPISYLFRITVESGTFTVDNPMQLLTGTIFTINPGAELIINNDLMIRSTAFKPRDGGPFWYPEVFEAAQLINNGKITINSGKIGGEISSMQEGAVVQTGEFTHGVTACICKGERKDKLSLTVTVSGKEEITEANLELVNSDSTTIVAATSTTYTYNGLIWA